MPRRRVVAADSRSLAKTLLAVLIVAALSVPIAQDIAFRGFPAKFYDLQGLLISDNDTSGLIYNVTASQQSSDCPYGAAYLLNGIGTNSYWFQDGLAWNWRNGGAGQFDLIFDVFDSVGKVVYPSGVIAGGGLVTFTGPVRNGDSVRIVLAPGAGVIQMNAYDVRTHALAATSYPYNTTKFVGVGLANGFFTGLMTECYRGVPGASHLARTTYTDLSGPMEYAGLCIDERNFSDGSYPVGTAPNIPLGCSGDHDLQLPQPISYTNDALDLTANSTSFSSTSD
jgi:hypothetical protein